VITVVKEINEPRLPSLKGKMNSKKAQITVWKASDIDADPQQCGLNGSPTKVIRIFTPAARSDGEILVGEPEETTAKLVDKLMPIIVGASN
jgi:electron transfer flavoprotein beta subunit